MVTDKSHNLVFVGSIPTPATKTIIYKLHKILHYQNPVVGKIVQVHASCACRIC